MNRLNQSRRNNSISLTYEQRHPYKVSRRAFLQAEKEPALMANMGGEGSFADAIKSAYTKGRNLAKLVNPVRHVSDAYSSEVGTALRNIIPASTDTARPGYPGEKHGILKLGTGRTGVANFMGPGTRLIDRLKRGDPPRSEVDKVSQGHDIRYGLAETLADIRKADNIMIKKVNQIARDKADYPINIAQARLIKAKVLGENLGVIKRDAFSGDLAEASKNLPRRDRALMVNKLNSLQQQGYGLHPSGSGLGLPGGALMLAGQRSTAQRGSQRLLPGDELKMKLLKDMVRAKKKVSKLKGKGQSMSRDLGKSYKLIGSGAMQIGRGEILDFIIKTVLPSLFSAVGISSKGVDMTKLTGIINKSIELVKSGNVEQIVNQLTKVILPIVSAYKVQEVAKNVAKKSGMGLKLAGSGLKLAGQGLSDILGDKRDMLTRLLNEGLLKAFKFVLNMKNSTRPEHRAKRQGGRGLNFSDLVGGMSDWDRFWAGFAKGFLSVIKPGAKILSVVAKLLGHPEISTGLDIASGLLDKL